MNNEDQTVSRSEFDALVKETHSFRRIFGVSIIAVVVVLIYVLPTVIENTTFRSQRVLELQSQQDYPMPTSASSTMQDSSTTTAVSAP